MTRHLIALASMGGTIAMTDGGGDGLKPSLDSADLVAAIPELAGRIELVSEPISSVGSPSVRFDDVRRAYRWTRAAIADGAVGAVVTHGTDTLKETAFLLGLWWDQPHPLVVTGAMRSPEESGADGGANLLAAILTAISPESRDRGVLAVMNDEVFAADSVTKARTFGVDAFQSTRAVLGRVIEGDVEYALAPRSPRPEPLAVPRGEAWVPIVSAPLGEDARVIEAIAAAQPDALVVDGVGAGHVPETMVAALADLAQRVPVVVASRTGRGRTGRTTYGYPGAEIDLLERGVLMSGHFTAVQARLLLWSLVADGVVDRSRIALEFARRG